SDREGRGPRLPCAGAARRGVRPAAREHLVGPPRRAARGPRGPARVPRPGGGAVSEVRVRQLLGLGQSVWLDYIHRHELRSGVFAAQVRDQGVVGVTSNPTIFQQAIASGDTYDASIERLLGDGLAGPALFERLAIEDIQTACDLLAAEHARSGGLDGRASI